MLASQPPHHHRLSTAALHRVPPPLAAIKPYRVSVISSSLSDHKERDAAPSDETAILRTHNAKSAAVILRHLSSHEEDGKNLHEANRPIELPVPKLDREKLLEISLQSRRTPQFPGSIYANIPSKLVQRVFFQGEKSNSDHEDEIDDKMLMKALEIRRKVTAQVFKEAMKKGKFGITYSENLVAEIPEFLDYVMIKAVSMKQSSEFWQCSYNVRARAFIDESEVVPIVR